jgi:hypothetical protein
LLGPPDPLLEVASLDLNHERLACMTERPIEVVSFNRVKLANELF